MKALILLATVFLVGCSGSSEKVLTVLQNDGFEYIELTGNAWLGCSDDDFVFASYHFAATKNSKGMTGTVCCGLIFKGCTIRY